MPVIRLAGRKENFFSNAGCRKLRQPNSSRPPDRMILMMNINGEITKALAIIRPPAAKTKIAIRAPPKIRR